MDCSTRYFLISIAALLSLSEPTAAKERWKPKGILAAVKIDRSHSHLYVPVRVGDREVAFVLDTGATGTLVDTSLLGSTAPTTRSYELQLLDGPVRVPAYEAPKMSIAGIDAPWIVMVAATDLTPLRSAWKNECYGILGMDFLRRFILHIDFDNGELLICDATQIDSLPGKGVELKLEQSCPTVSVSPGSLPPRQFLIDTGYTGTGSLRIDLFSELERTGEARSTGLSAQSGGLHGRSGEVAMVNCSRIKLGEFHHRDLVLSTRQKNILGLTFLCRYSVTLDFPHGLLCLDPGEKFGLRDRQDYLGMRLAYDDLHQLGVEKLIPNGPAGRSGLLQNDMIMEINGKRAGEWSGPAIDLLFTTPTADDINLHILRNGKSRVVRIPGG